MEAFYPSYLSQPACGSDFLMPGDLVFVFPYPRFESLEPEMNNQASRVAVVNQIARQLMHSGHPGEKIKAQQDKLNTR